MVGGGGSEKDSAGRFLNFSTEELGTNSKKEKHWVFQKVLEISFSFQLKGTGVDYR